MQILQWSITIPKDQQKRFISWFNDTSGPVLGGFGASGHELYKVNDQHVIGRQTLEHDRFIERVYFEDDANISDYFSKVRDDPNAYKISRSYEEVFGATDIELRVLVRP